MHEGKFSIALFHAQPYAFSAFDSGRWQSTKTTEYWSVPMLYPSNKEAIDYVHRLARWWTTNRMITTIEVTEFRLLKDLKKEFGSHSFRLVGDKTGATFFIDFDEEADAMMFKLKYF